MQNAAAIAAVEGVDGVFIGPADLSASLGHRGNPGHPEVQAAMRALVATVLAAGKAAGSLLSDATLAREFIDRGCSFMAVGVDTTLLARATQALAQSFKGVATASPAGTGGGY
jgi:4-hydroxy-2-oxoheptanedioate aldolase